MRIRRTIMQLAGMDIPTVDADRLVQSLSTPLSIGRMTLGIIGEATVRGVDVFSQLSDDVAREAEEKITAASHGAADLAGFVIDRSFTIISRIGGWK